MFTYIVRYGHLSCFNISFSKISIVASITTTYRCKILSVKYYYHLFKPGLNLPPSNEHWHPHDKHRLSFITISFGFKTNLTRSVSRVYLEGGRFKTLQVWKLTLFSSPQTNFKTPIGKIWFGTVQKCWNKNPGGNQSVQSLLECPKIIKTFSYSKSIYLENSIEIQVPFK